MNLLQRFKIAIKCLKAKNKSVLITFQDDLDIKKSIIGKNYIIEVSILDTAIKNTLFRKIVLDIASQIDIEKNNYQFLFDYFNIIENEEQLKKQDAALNEVYKILNNG